VARKGLVLVLEEVELQELYRIILDEDEEAALLFLQKHLKGKILQALEGGCKVMIEVPGRGKVLQVHRPLE